MIQLALAILLSAAAAATSADARVTLLDGTTVAGRLLDWNPGGLPGGLVISTADGRRDIPANQLLDVRWDREAPAEPPGMSVEFVDGARVAALAYTAAGRTASIQTPYADSEAQGNDKPLRISTERIARVHLMPPSDASRAVWQQLEERELAGDVLLVVKKEATQLDYLTGVVGNVTADQVAFEYDGQKLQVKRNKVAGIGYFHAEQPRLPEAACELTLVDGSVIPARSVAMSVDGRLRVSTPAGVRLTMPLDDVVRADFSAGKLAYLSDLTATNVKWTPRIATPRAADLIAGYGLPRNDVSYSGSPLSLGWVNESLPTGHEIRTYAKGLALRSRTEATYRLPNGMRRFTAIAGIDPATADQGHVVLEIRADDRVLWEGEIDGKRDPVQIDLDLGAARRLQLRVDYGQNLDYGDRLHLVEARVTK